MAATVGYPTNGERKDMRAITLYQPWATFIAIGVKRYETRAWAPDFFGPLAIHASKSTEYLDLCDTNKAFREVMETYGLTKETLPMGAVVCICRLIAVHRTERVIHDAFGDYSDGRFAWEVSDVKPLVPPIVARGYQKIWNWRHPDEGQGNLQLGFSMGGDGA